MRSFLLIACALMAFVSCKQKVQDENIIVDKVVTKKIEANQKMEDSEQNGSFQWIKGADYRYTILRAASDSLPHVVNHDIPYTDNTITLSIKRSNGSVFFTKTFTKENFSPVLPKQFMESGVLLSMNFNKVVDNEAFFVVSVGSPDENNEEFCYAQLVLDNYGKTRAEAYNEAME